jgi:hypothetical protein
MPSDDSFRRSLAAAPGMVVSPFLRRFSVAGLGAWRGAASHLCDEPMRQATSIATVYQAKKKATQPPRT